MNLQQYYRVSDDQVYDTVGRYSQLIICKRCDRRAFNGSVHTSGPATKY